MVSPELYRNYKTRYLYGPAVDQVLAEESVTSLLSAGNVLWLLADHEGTIRDVADYDSQSETTSVVNHLQYAAFGEILSQTGSYTPTFTYTGRQYDAETGLYYYRTRWYDAHTGKFISKDPIGFAVATRICTGIVKIAQQMEPILVEHLDQLFL